MASANFHFNAQASLLKIQTTTATSVALNLDSTIGVSSVVWSVSSTDETSAGEWSISNPTSILTATLNTPATGTDKSCIVQCVINNGVAATPRATAKAYIGFEVGSDNEVLESDPVYGWGILLNPVIRALGGITNVATAISNAVSALLSNDVPEPLGVADPGDSSTAARSNHVHELPVIPGISGDAPTGIGTANAGVSSDASASDHTHASVITGGSSATPAENSVGLYVDADDVLIAKNDDGQAMDVSARGMIAVSSGTPTLVAGRVYYLSGTVTAATLPDCAASRGLPIGVVNATAGTVTVSRAGADTIDFTDSSSYAIGTLSSVVFDPGPSTRWVVW